MSQDLVRFSVAMPEDLLNRFDEYVAGRGVAKNRSEVIRDLVREAISQEECAAPGAYVVGSLTIAYDHHANDLQERLHEIQHQHCDNVVSTMHVHLDAHHCLETIILRGEASLVQDLGNAILGCKGVLNGHLVLTSAEHHYDHGNPHEHSHIHAHSHGGHVHVHEHGPDHHHD